MANEKWMADAHELLVEIERIYDDHYFRSYDQCVHDIFNAMRRIVKRYAKFRAVEVVHGRWQYDDDIDRHYCSVCGKHAISYRYLDEQKREYTYVAEVLTDYCYDCGADMR